MSYRIRHDQHRRRQIPVDGRLLDRLRHNRRHSSAARWKAPEQAVDVLRLSHTTASNVGRTPAVTGGDGVDWRDDLACGPAGEGVASGCLARAQIG
jgi:hypothetical protein